MHSLIQIIPVTSAHNHIFGAGCLQDAVRDVGEELPDGDAGEGADNGADAMHLLRALAVQDPAVQEKVKSTDAAPSRPSCCVM